MEFSVTHEAYVFLCSALSGLVICLLGDVFCVLRKKCGNLSVFTDISDIIFWVSAAVIMFAVIFFANSGRVRWYEFFGVILGAVLYKFTLSRVILVIFELFLEIFFKIFKFFFKILLTPLIFLYNIVFKGIMFIFRPIYKLIIGFLAKTGKRMRFMLSLARRTAKKS